VLEVVVVSMRSWASSLPVVVATEDSGCAAAAAADDDDDDDVSVVVDVCASVRSSPVVSEVCGSSKYVRLDVVSAGLYLKYKHLVAIQTRRSDNMTLRTLSMLNAVNTRSKYRRDVDLMTI